MNRRLVLLHGWGADGDDLRPLGDALKARLGGSLDLVTLDAPELHPQGSGRQWYGLFPAQWDAVPAAINQLQISINDAQTKMIKQARQESASWANANNKLTI